MALVKKDLVVLKNTGKIHIVKDCMTEKDNIITIHDGHSRPTYGNSPFHNYFQGTFFNDGNYQLLKGVEIDEAIIGNHMQYQVVANGEGGYAVQRIDVYGTAGYAKAIMDLQGAVAELKK